MKKSFNKQSWIVSALRRTTFRFPPAISAENKVKTITYVPSKKGKLLKRVFFECLSCGKKGLKRKEVNRDHKIPVVGSEGFTNWNDFIERLFCDEENWQIVCVACHSIKTHSENLARKLNKT